MTDSGDKDKKHNDIADETQECRVFDDGEMVWSYVAESIEPIDKTDIMPLVLEGDVALTESLPKKTVSKEKRSPSSRETFRSPQPKRQATQPPSSGLDRKTSKKLQRGQMTIDATLDLHGMTQEQAYSALKHFVSESYNQGRRCLLVITGKGSGPSHSDPYGKAPGVLKRNVPRWLSEPLWSSIILSIEQARPQHGGGGALYILLRRNRDV